MASCSSKTSDPAAAETPAEKPPIDSVTLSAESLKLVGVEIAPVSRGHLSMTLRSPGRISVNVNRTAKVTSTLEGRIRTMTYDIGAEVRAGDAMALIDSPELLNQPLIESAPYRPSDRAPRHGRRGGRQGEGALHDQRPSNLWAIAEIKEKDIPPGARRPASESSGARVSAGNVHGEGRAYR